MTTNQATDSAKPETAEREELIASMQQLAKKLQNAPTWESQPQVVEGWAYDSPLDAAAEALINAAALLSAAGQECTRSHPHDEMSPMCELRTEIARLNNKLANREADGKAGGEVVAWSDKAMELATDFAVDSLRVGSYERKDLYENGGVASWQTVNLREKREQSRERLRQHLYTRPQQAAQVAHSDDIAVDKFSVAMKEKLAAARAKGRGGWESCDPNDLRLMLREHVEKGDPRDVANFCMFLWNLGHGIGKDQAS